MSSRDKYSNGLHYTKRSGNLTIQRIQNDISSTCFLLFHIRSQSKALVMSSIKQILQVVTAVSPLIRLSAQSTLPIVERQSPSGFEGIYTF